MSKKNKIGHFFFCDSCSNPIYKPEDGLIFCGNVCAANPLEENVILDSGEKTVLCRSCCDKALFKKAPEKQQQQNDSKAKSTKEDIFIEYILNIIAYVNNEKIDGQEPDERLMRSIEMQINLPDQDAPHFRRNIATSIGVMAGRGQKFCWDSNPHLKKAFDHF